MVTHYAHKGAFKIYRNSLTRRLQKRFKIEPHEANCIMEIYGEGVHYYYSMLFSVDDAVNHIEDDMVDEDLQLARLPKVSK